MIRFNNLETEHGIYGKNVTIFFIQLILLGRYVAIASRLVSGFWLNERALHSVCFDTMSLSKSSNFFYLQKAVVVLYKQLFVSAFLIFSQSPGLECVLVTATAAAPI